MTVNVLENDSLWEANGKGWDQSEKGLLDTNKGVASANWQYVCHHPYKTAATFLAIATVASLTAAYFLSPAYAAFVGTVVTKAATLVSPAITAVSAFLVAHPLVASLIVVAAVAALIAAPVYAYKNSSKANQIDAVKEVLNKCEKDGDKVKVKDGDASTLLTEIGIAIGVVPAPAKA
ncbi:uncharacterized protein TNCT_505811 [Trichonephila clavata]|uniref:Uncharacterized protein n=1 Tax=Trichonephila clavata TaxID=2740835 RepID=A0A8X6LZK4_TRICU|nr:uncharacterized protein TNCT_8731 [Trichonephila clavata]GFR26487.1 uncharacterized protein TNCT_505811 [Trichonephila clavata]